MRTFSASRQNYERNRERAASLRVAPAHIAAPGEDVQGVALFSGKLLISVLEPEAAFALANGIADALEGSTC